MVAVLLVISLGLMLADGTGALNPVKQVVSTVLSPLERGALQFGKNLSRAGDFFGDLEQLRTENARLRVELEEQRGAQGKIAELANRIDQLERQLEFKKNPESSKFALVGADVINRDTGGVNRGVFINKGAEQGIAKGQPVVDSAGYLLGQVSRVENDKSYVLLISDSNLGVNIMTQRFADGKKVPLTPPVDGIVFGQFQAGNGTLLKVSRVKADADLKVEDWIFTSGFGGAFPPNLLIGKVERVVDRAGQPEKEAVVRPIAELDYVQQVLVITSWGQK
jgi:rod shape-determining protein MreC